ncbi:MAG: oligosaccharide flippase family protein, partial [Leeuwenhoekiella sp.]
PFIIAQLGKSEYGLYTMVGALISGLSVLDIGIGNAVVRFTAKYRAEEDKKGEENFLATVFYIYSAISFVITIAGLILYFNLDLLYDQTFTDEELRKTKIMFGILIFNLAITLPGSVFGAYCSAYEQFVYPKTVKITRYIIRSLLVVAVLLYGTGAISLVIIDTLMGISVVVANARYCFKKLDIKIKLHEFQKSLVFNIFSYSIWIFVFAIVSRLQWQAGQIVLGTVDSPAVVGIFSVGVTLGTYYGAFSTAISSVFLPRATKMFVKSASGEELTDMMIKIGRVSLLVLLYILFAFYLYGEQFVDLWVGSTYTDTYTEIYWIAVLIMLAYTVPLVQNFGNATLEAQNKLRFKAILYLVFALLGTGLGYWLARSYGAIGMITGTIIGWVIVQIVMNVYYHKVIHLNIPRFFKEVSHRIVLTGLVAFGIGYAVKYIPGDGWLNFVIKAILFSIVYMGLIYKFGTIAFEKGLFDGAIASAKQKIKR